jgi:hypothetical protein
MQELLSWTGSLTEGLAQRLGKRRLEPDIIARIQLLVGDVDPARGSSAPTPNLEGQLRLTRAPTDGS